MASSSGHSSCSTPSQLQNSGSEGDLQVLMDQRKRKRKESNRESARRSRMRKQKHLDDLKAQMTQLRKANDQILTTINVTTQHYLNAEADNSILRAQMMELSQRLDFLTEIINLKIPSNGIYGSDHHHPQGGPDDFMMNPLNLMYLSQPIMPSPDLFPY